LETELKVCARYHAAAAPSSMTFTFAPAQVSLLAIRERELDLYTNNCRNIGSQAALLAGFAYGALTYQVVDISGICTVFKAWEGTASHQECRLSLSYELTIGSYEVIAFLAMMLNVASAFGATVISMLGPGLALRGQDGAMDQAVEGLALEYRTVFLSLWAASSATTCASACSLPSTMTPSTASRTRCCI